LTLFGKSCLVLLEEFCGFLESILRILTVDTLVVEFSC
jgi:hypothetical protein